MSRYLTKHIGGISFHKIPNRCRFRILSFPCVLRVARCYIFKCVGGTSLGETMIDERDIKILSAIANLGTGSPDRLHEETDIPKSTIYYRLDNLREKDVIKNDLYDIDYEKIGLSVTVVSDITAEYGEGYHDRVGEKLSEVEGVDQVYFTMGDTDFVVIARLGNQSMAEDLMTEYESIDEVLRTSSKFVISTIKNEPRLFNNFQMETLQSIVSTESD